MRKTLHSYLPISCICSYRLHQGTELIQIFNTVYKQYTLNITKMLAYAKRRTKEQELIEFITNNTQLTELLSE